MRVTLPLTIMATPRLHILADIATESGNYWQKMPPTQNFSIEENRGKTLRHVAKTVVVVSYVLPLGLPEKYVCFR